MAYTFQQLVQYAEQGGFPAQVAPTAAAIAIAESSGDNVIQQGQPYSTRGWGLWQITPGNSEPQYGTDNALLDPVTNARAAYAKYTGAGNTFRPWTTFNNGVYMRYMNGNSYTPSPGNPGGAPGANVNQSGTPSSLDGIATDLSVLGRLAMPGTWIRLGAGFAGFAMVAFGIVLLAREAKA